MISIIRQMRKCWQVEHKQTVWAHGWAVWREVEKIIISLEKDSEENLNIPAWMKENAQFILSQLVSRRELKLYAVLHDCGKPFCKPDS